MRSFSSWSQESVNGQKRREKLRLPRPARSVPLRLAFGLGVSADVDGHDATVPRVANGRNRARRRRKKSDGRKNESERGVVGRREERAKRRRTRTMSVVDLWLRNEAEEKLNGEGRKERRRWWPARENCVTENRFRHTWRRRGGFAFLFFCTERTKKGGREWNPKKWGELITSVILRKKSTTTLEWRQDFIARVREREREREKPFPTLYPPARPCVRNNSGVR